MNKYRVLVDSSVWIQYFKFGNIEYLDQLIENDVVCINELILTELGPKLIHQKRLDIWNSLNSLEKVTTRINWDVIRNYQVMNLKNGINNVGIPDLIILQQVIEEKIALFTLDKHFKLMTAFLKYELIQF
ncbi:PIN domain-containing protein [Algoriphagus sp. D3-2-R+10]|uniref:PIN domain-containing protein n=1 Tax=Algoriphagus aurantiacus TaxID=3103948 RepID=UPI002B3FEFC2|nr:PIN domain-containing protein [Algoriphagus sp. D3-2-R+10]MEB2773860.1 PIN domain-containing protein [Algoriphagus sp. D3-2-R+10]